MKEVLLTLISTASITLVIISGIFIVEYWNGSILMFRIVWTVIVIIGGFYIVWDIAKLLEKERKK